MRETTRPPHDSAEAEITHTAPAPAAPRRCEVNQVGLFGECLACGAWQGEACLELGELKRGCPHCGYRHPPDGMCV